MGANPKYIRDVITVLGLEEAKPVTTSSVYSVKETARKITCPTESDEMNLKRIVRYLKGAPSAKSLIEIITPSKFVNVYTDSDWAGQATTCKNTSGGVVQW